MNAMSFLKCRLKTLQGPQSKWIPQRLRFLGCQIDQVATYLNAMSWLTPWARLVFQACDPFLVEAAYPGGSSDNTCKTCLQTCFCRIESLVLQHAGNDASSLY